MYKVLAMNAVAMTVASIVPTQLGWKVAQMIFSKDLTCKCTNPEYSYCFDSGENPNWDGRCYKSATSFDYDATCSPTNKCVPKNQNH